MRKINQCICVEVTDAYSRSPRGCPRLLSQPNSTPHYLRLSHMTARMFVRFSRSLLCLFSVVSHECSSIEIRVKGTTAVVRIILCEKSIVYMYSFSIFQVWLVLAAFRCILVAVRELCLSISLYFEENIFPSLLPSSSQLTVY